MDIGDYSNNQIKLLNVDDRYIHLTDCEKRWQGLKVKFTFDESRHCVIVKRTTNDECVKVFTGASLHSLQRLESSERHFLRGFEVFGPKICSIYYPVVYTNTDGYMDWIMETMEQPAGLPFDLRKELIFSDK